ESNDKAIVLGGDQGGYQTNIAFIGSTLTRTSDPTACPGRTFVSYYFSNQGGPSLGIQVIGSSYVNGAPSSITWMNAGTKEWTVGWVLTTVVQDANGHPLSGATVNLLGANGTVVATGTTDNQGNLIFDVGTTQYSGTTNPTATSIGPTSITVSLAGHNPVT